MREILFRGFHKSHNPTIQIALRGESFGGFWCRGKPFEDAGETFMVRSIRFERTGPSLVMRVTPVLLPVIADTIGQFSGLLDKNRKQIFEGDIVLGWRGYVASDGYMRKGYPDRINVICVVEFSCGSFRLKEIRPTDEHIEASKMYDYRINGAVFNPLRRGPLHYNPVTKKHDMQGDDMTCPDIEVIGNIFENPDLLIKPEDA